MRKFFLIAGLCFVGLILVAVAVGAYLIWENERAAERIGYQSACVQARDINLQIEKCTFVIERYPARAALAYSVRASAFARKGDHDKAVADMNVVIAREPNDAHHFGSRARMYEDQGKIELAKADYDQAIRLNPKDAYSYYWRSVFNTERDLKAAIEDLDRAILLDPKDQIFALKRELLKKKLDSASPK